MNEKKLASPFSTGGGGGFFEAHVQAAFVTLMITGGYTPCFPFRSIIEVKLQGKIDGYATDDLIVTTEDPASKERRKLLGQVKHSITITKGDKLLPDVLLAAWIDFNNPAKFTQGKDALALITGALNATDQRNVSWLLEKARNTSSVEEFYQHVKQVKFSPAQAENKLDAIRSHLDAANDGTSLSDDQLYLFLKHFHLLGYDLDIEYGVAKSLLHSHISQYQHGLPSFVWSRILELVQQKNQHATGITKANLPEDLLEMFKKKVAIEFPEGLETKKTQSVTDWANHPDANYLALALLIGAWNEK